MENYKLKHIQSINEYDSEYITAKIKYVADVNDKKTLSILKLMWNGMNETERKEVLDKNGHSHKHVDSKFEDLTDEIKSYIATTYEEVKYKK